MFAFTRSDVQRIAVSAAGALFFSAVCIGGAIAPAQAAAATPMTAWQTNAAQHIDRDIALPDWATRFATRNAQIGVVVAPDGTVSQPTLLQSSGSRRLDRMLIQRAGAMTLAPLASPRNVVLRIALRNDSWAPVTWPATARYAAR